jgi:phage anti-repressor protein
MPGTLEQKLSSRTPTNNKSPYQTDAKLEVVAKATAPFVQQGLGGQDVIKALSAIKPQQEKLMQAQAKNNHSVPSMLIQSIELNDETTPSVDARELHGRLDSREMFAHWIKGQIRRAMLVDGVDYVIGESPKNPKGGRPSISYSLSLDAAKNICMMSQSVQGQALRKYFIEVEKRYRLQPTAEDPQELMAKALVWANEQLQLLAPKAKVYDNFKKGKTNYPLTLAARTYGMSARALSSRLLSAGCLTEVHKRGKLRRLPAAGMEQFLVTDDFGATTEVTPTGMQWLKSLLDDGQMSLL